MQTLTPSPHALASDPAVAPFELVCPPAACPHSRPRWTTAPDCVYLGLRDATNARNFAGLNFDEAAIASGIALRPRPRLQGLHGAQHLPAGGQPRALAQPRWTRPSDLGVDAVILADPGLMHYAAQAPPAAAPAPVGAGLGHQLRRHQLLPPAVRHRRAPCCRACCRSTQVRAGDREDPGGDRGVWLWQPVRDGRRALRAVVLRHRRVAQHPRRVLAAQGGALAGNAARAWSRA